MEANPEPDTQTTKSDRFWRLVARKTPDTIVGRFLAVAINLVLVIAVVWWLVRWVHNASWTKILFVTIVIVASFVLVFLSSVFPRVARAIKKAANLYASLVYWYIVTAAPVMFFFWLAPRIPDKSKALQWTVFVAWGLLLVFGSTTVFTEKYRNRFFPWLRRRVGGFAPCAYALNLLFIALLFFSSLTYVLVKHQVLTLERPPVEAREQEKKHLSGEIVQVEIVDFYAWHFLEAIPLLKVNDRLHYKQPLIYSGAGAGWLLLAFQVMVILPVIRAFAWYWKHDEPSAKGAAVVYQADKTEAG